MIPEGAVCVCGHTIEEHGGTWACDACPDGACTSFYWAAE
jgi:hypothetical protein